MDSLKAFEMLKTIIEDVNEKTNSLTQQLSQYDLEQQDILHFIENKKLNAVQMSKVFRLLKEIRESRRKTKNELSRYTSLASKLSGKSNLLECKLELKPEDDFYELRTDVLNSDFGFAVGSKMYFGEAAKVIDKKEIFTAEPTTDDHIATPTYVTSKIEETLGEKDSNNDNDDDCMIEAIMSHPEDQKIILTDMKTRVKIQCNSFEKAVVRAIGGGKLGSIKPTELIKNISGTMKAIKLGNEYLGYRWEVN